MLASLLVAVLLAPQTAPEAQGDDWPQWRGPQRDGIWREKGICEDLPDEIEPRWTAEIGAGYCGPTVADGRVYVMDRVTEPEQLERVHCFGWDTGEPIWSHAYAASYAGVQYTDGPRCVVQVEDGLAWSLGTMGHLFCFDAATGEVVWKHDLDADYDVALPIWGIAAAPVVEGDLLIVPACGAKAWLVAFDKRTGEERWKAFEDRGNYSAPIVIDQAGERVLVCWSGDRVVGVAPASGELLWEYPLPSKNMPLGVPTPIVCGDRLFVTGFYDGCALLRLDQDEPAVEELWRLRGQNERRTMGLHSTISTPIAIGEHVYGVDSYGELRCLALADGERVWEDTTAVPRSRWATIHFVRRGETGERVWMFTERGELVLGDLSPEGFAEVDRGKLIEPTRGQLNRRDGVCWSHPAFAYGHVFARNDGELRCADLRAR